MKKLLIYIILFHQFASGYWIFGYAIPQVTSIVIDSDGWCVKFEGEQRECSESERYLMNTLKKNYESP